MQATYHYAIIALVCNLLLGAAVFSVNPRRPTNRSFLLLTAALCLWLSYMMVALSAGSTGLIAHSIRWMSVAGAFWPATFALLRMSITYHREHWAQHFRRSGVWMAVALGMAAFCLSPFFLVAVRLVQLPTGGKVPSPVYWMNGLAGRVYFAYLAISFVMVLILLIRDQYNVRITGVQRVELQFLLLGYSTVILGFFLNLTVTAFTHNERLNQYTPLRVVAFTIIIAYGITSRGILNVRSALRLGLSYLLLAVYAGIVFVSVWYVMQRAFGWLGFHSEFAQALCSGVTMAMLVNSAGTPLRRVAKKILPSAGVDFERTVGDVARIVQTVTIFSELIEQFSTVLRRAVGTPKVSVYLVGPDGFYEQCPDGARGERLALNDIVLEEIHAKREDVATEDLHRRAPSLAREVLLNRLERLGVDLIIPIRHHNLLSGLLMLAPRVSGRVYGPAGRETLRLIAEQLGVAVANARLYTEARQSQAYNQFLVEHLSCGVIATNPAGELTVVNPEARRLLHLDENAPPSEIELEPNIARLIPPTLQGDTIAHDEEIILRSGARDQAHVRVSCLPFASERDQLLGAVLVINDHTALEHLQRQVRQADRLASIGTLASGMAHEIKNPLTALKTFTQLLPKRYNDAEFRDDFSGLAGSEIARIERIVNQLLAFARPAPLMIEQVSLHEVIAGAMRLVGPQASRLQVEIRKSLRAGADLVAADKDRLQQVLLNLLLNALQASEPGGYIELSTELELGLVEREPLVRLDVRDNGSGIPADLLSHIFDPFFTTKSEGTGLGLSVSYNIIAEHKGRLEVHSQAGTGTCFSVYLHAC